jgi:hypothetical protein
MSTISAPLVIGVFGDEVRAEQAVRALEVWKSANNGVGVGPIGVVSRGVSGTTTWRSRGVTRTGRAVLRGLVVGLFLFGLPAAGAAALAAWAFGSLAFGLLGLVGVVPSGSVGGLVIAVMLGAASIAGVLVGLIGAGLGCLVGLLVGVIDGQVRGLTGAEAATTAEALPPGAWATVARVQFVAEPLVRDEMARMGAEPVLEREPLPAAPPAPAPQQQELPAAPAPEGSSEGQAPAGSPEGPESEGSPETPMPAGSRKT